MKRTNILLITSDQQHWNTLGFMNPEVKTPNLDRLARQGTNFTRAYTVNPTCTPSRASILTGMYPSQHGAYSLGTKLMEDQHVVGDDFLAAGYRTTLVGKAHFQPLKSTPEFPSLEAYPALQDLEFWRKFRDKFYGFEHVELARNHADEAHVGQHYALWMEEKGLKNWRDFFRKPTGTVDQQQHHWPLPEEYHYDTWISERSCALLEQYEQRQENFFLWASFFDPHPPYLVPAPYDTMYDPAKITVPAVREGEHDLNPPHFGQTQEENPDFSRFSEPAGQYCHGLHSHRHDKAALAKDIAVYYGMITLMDKHIGIILDKLEQLGLAENTLVVFTTDHGHFFGHHGLTAKGPFHYEDVIKVPFLASLPGAIPAGKSSDALVSLVDLAPTMLSFAGLPIPRCMTGVDEKPLWTGEKDAIRDHILCENRHQPNRLYAKTYVNDRYKLTTYRGETYGELFDLKNDPGEHQNLWDDPAAATLKAKLLLQFLHAELGKDPTPMPRIHGS